MEEEEEKRRERVRKNQHREEKRTRESLQFFHLRNEGSRMIFAVKEEDIFNVCFMHATMCPHLSRRDAPQYFTFSVSHAC